MGAAQSYKSGKNGEARIELDKKTRYLYNWYKWREKR